MWWNFPKKINILGELSAQFFTDWTYQLSLTRLQSTQGVFRRVVLELTLLSMFGVLMVVSYFFPTENPHENFAKVSNMYEVFSIGKENHNTVCAN